MSGAPGGEHAAAHGPSRRGVATAICGALEARCRDLGLDAVTVHASRTALPFFLHRGYRVEREQQVPVRGQTLTNYAMRKTLNAL